MYLIELAGAVILAYLAGSLNTAILVSRIVGGEDIRTLGNRNPGTTNIGRTLGRGWAAAVFFGDVGKAVVPMVIAERLFFSAETAAGMAALTSMGMSAMLGHIKPIYFHFKGGGGLATTLGVIAFFVPFELVLSMLIGFPLGMLFFKNKKYKLGRWVAMLIILMNPAICLLTTVLLDISVAGRIKIGGHPWRLLIAVTVLVAFIVLINIKTVLHPAHEKR